MFTFPSSAHLPPEEVTFGAAGGGIGAQLPALPNNHPLYADVALLRLEAQPTLPGLLLLELEGLQHHALVEAHTCMLLARCSHDAKSGRRWLARANTLARRHDLAWVQARVSERQPRPTRRSRVARNKVAPLASASVERVVAML